MYRGKRYKKVKKKCFNFFMFYIVIAVLIFSSYTFSKYTTAIEDNAVASVAKFSIEVNNKDIKTEKTFEIELNSDKNINTYNNKIAPDTEGFFEIEINPTGTEVSLEYEITFNLTGINGSLQLTKYIVNGGNEENITDNVINGMILLPTTEHAFTENDKVNIRIYWEWKEDIVNPTFTNTNITVNSTIQQIINKNGVNRNEK